MILSKSKCVFAVVVVICASLLAINIYLTKVHRSSSLLKSNPIIEVSNHSTITSFVHQSWKNKDLPPRFIRFVHQSWKNKDLPPRFIRWFATWEICFPSYEHRLWTDDDNLELVRQKAPDFLDQYIRYKDKIQRADAVRYLYMYHYGGIYSDLDNECLRTFQHLIDNSGCGIILGSMRYSGKQQYIQNSFMYSRPKHPFWLKVIEAMKERSGMVGSYPQNTVDLTTGPKLLMHSVNQHKTTYEGTQNPGSICVFPDTFFNPYSWDIDKRGPCKDLNKMTETDLANCKMKHKKAYVIQYHTQSWFSGQV